MFPFGGGGGLAVDVRKLEPSRGFIAVKREIDVNTANQVRYLTPSNGNVHRFRARQWTAVFDLAVPPYDPLQGRPCHYFRVVSDSGKIECNALL